MDLVITLSFIGIVLLVTELFIFAVRALTKQGRMEIKSWLSNSYISTSKADQLEYRFGMHGEVKSYRVKRAVIGKWIQKRNDQTALKLMRGHHHTTYNPKGKNACK